MPYICDICQKQLKTSGSLKAHKAKFHSAANNDKKSKVEAEPLELKVENDAEGEDKYECADCHAEVKPGMLACPGCGETLVWS